MTGSRKYIGSSTSPSFLLAAGYGCTQTKRTGAALELFHCFFLLTHKAEHEWDVDNVIHLSRSSAVDQHCQAFFSSQCLKNMDCKSAAALLVFCQFWVAIFKCQSWVWVLPSKNNLGLRKSCMGAGMLLLGRIACEPIHSHLLHAPAQKTVNEAQILVHNVIYFLTSLDLVAYL